MKWIACIQHFRLRLYVNATLRGQNRELRYNLEFGCLRCCTSIALPDVTCTCLDKNRPAITISDSTLEYVNVSKLLSVHFHQHLDLDKHVLA